MNLVDVYASWRASISIFEKKNFKLFFLVSLKTLKTALPLVLKYGGVLLALDYTLRRYILPPEYEWSAWFVFRVLITFVMLLFTRASLEPKTASYFKKYVTRVWDVALLLSIPSITYFLILGGFAFVTSRFESVVHPAHILTGDLIASFVLFSPLLIPMLTLSGFFVLDSNGGVKNAAAALTRSMLALVYYLPVMVVFGIVGLFAFEVLEPLPLTSGIVGLVGGGQSILAHLVVMPLGYLAKIVLHLLYVSLMANYYLKLKHGNYKLFFNQ